MNESLAATLGELQAQIYWLHDAEEFTELASAATTIPLFCHSPKTFAISEF